MMTVSMEVIVIVMMMILDVHGIWLFNHNWYFHRVRHWFVNLNGDLHWYMYFIRHFHGYL